MKALKNVMIATLSSLLFSYGAAGASESFRYTGDGEAVDFLIEQSGNSLTLYLAVKDGNEPLEEAKVSVVPDDESIPPFAFTAGEQPGVYMAEYEGKMPEGNLTVAGDVEDEVEIYEDDHGSLGHDDHEGHDHSHGGAAKSSLPQVSSGLVFTLSGVFIIGLVLGRLTSRGSSVGEAVAHVPPESNHHKNPGVDKVSALLLLGAVAAFAPGLSDTASAGEGHTHAVLEVSTRGGEKEIFVSKKSQFLLGLRTWTAEASVPEKGFRAFGHAMAAPMYDAVIKSPATGVFRPAKQLVIGAPVRKDEILGYIDSVGSFPVRSPIAGSLMSVDIYQGLRAETGVDLFRVTDTKVLWIDAEVFQKDLPKIRQAGKVTVHIDGMAPVSGRITSLKTKISEETLTGKVFVEVDNKDDHVAVGSVAIVSFVSKQAESSKDDQAFVVERSAVLSRGAEMIVFVQTGPEQFEQKTVVTDQAASPDKIIIRSGINAGDRVVVSGNYQLLTAAH